MERSGCPRPDPLDLDSVIIPGKAAASWPAMIAGAFVAISVSLILLALGSGLGITSLLTAEHGISGKGIVATTATWLIVTQWISAGLGGYIAGRLRARWHGTHTHEVFFRDTAHGLVTWAVATVVLAALVGASVPSLIAGGLHAASLRAPTASASASPAGAGSPSSPYGIDKLFRSTSPGETQDSSDARVEADHILETARASGSLPEADRTYLTALIAAKAGISPSDAQIRINDWLATSLEADAKTKAEAAASREAAIYTALSLLIGAFIASVAAVLGGRLRDEHP